uniref:Uncharacterized protein n=1 Tax=Oryza glumipatula TaxID=40148 RepID=A0A0D9YLD5_9ORYZ
MVEEEGLGLGPGREEAKRSSTAASGSDSATRRKEVGDDVESARRSLPESASAPCSAALPSEPAASRRRLEADGGIC